jgi:hypothetical protein
MNTFLSIRIPVVAGLLGQLCLSAQAVMWDDFESYPYGIALTQGYTPGPNSPWGRFGAATADNMICDFVGVDSSKGGDYPVVWTPVGNNGNLVYHFPTGTNLSVPAGFRVQLRIDQTTPVPTKVVGVFQEANLNIWGTIPALKPLLTNDTFQTFAFRFTPSEMELLDGTSPDPFSLTNVINIRIRFENAGAYGTNHIYIDNFESLPAAPVITGIGVSPAGAVKITFNCPEGEAAEFGLERTGSVGGAISWEADGGAVIQSTGTGSFEASTTTFGGTQFYRVRR